MGIRKLTMVLIAAIPLCLTACGSKEEGSAGAPQAGNAPGAANEEEKVVNVYNWAQYMEESLLEQFTAETGIKVRYDVYDANEMLETKLMAGNSGFDVVVPTASFVERQIKAGVFQKLDRSKIPNWKNLDPEIMARLARHDPGNQHVVDYMWGTDGIGYNETKVKAIMPDAPVDSWSLVFEPEIASRFIGCGISVLDAPADVVKVLLAYLGKDPNSESAEDLALAEQKLMAVRPYIRQIHSSSYINALANGEICIAVGWSGDVMQARDRAAEAGLDYVIKYSVPQEGTIIWFDTMAIPADAPHPNNAHAFINFMLRADVAGANSNLIHYANGNAASLEFVNESIRNDPSIYPPREVRDKLFPDLAQSAGYSRILNRSWTRFVTGE